MGGVGGETTAATTGNADASAKVSQYHQQKKAVVLNMSWLDIDQCRGHTHTFTRSASHKELL